MPIFLIGLLEQKLAGEKEVLGIYVSGHPLDRWKDKVSDLAKHFTDKLENLEKGTPVELCGILTAIQRKTNREGKYWAALKIDDGHGTVDAMVFATRYEEMLRRTEGRRGSLYPGLRSAGRGGPSEAFDSGDDHASKKRASICLPSFPFASG